MRSTDGEAEAPVDSQRATARRISALRGGGGGGSLSRPVVRSVRVRLCTLTFHGYARLRTLTPQHSARLCTLGLGDTEVGLLYSHAQVLCRKKIGAGGIFV